MTGFTGLWPYLVLVLVGFLPSDLWRLLGVIAASGIDEESELLIWVRAVATAVLAGVIAKILLFAPAALAQVPMAVRLSAIAFGFGMFLAVGRSVFAGLLAGEAALLIGGLLFP